MNLNKKNFINYLNTNFVFEKNPFFAIAVSGGPDSMALLYLLNEWKKIKKGKLIALIVNHNIRENSFIESERVSKFIKTYNIDYKILKVKKNQVQKKSMNEARINRYNLLTEYCQMNNIMHLFVAHHKDDNLETFLVRKISGSDFEGLFAMKQLSLINKTCLIRPMLNFTKKQIIKYNLKNKIPFIKDPTNQNLNYTRPIIRKYLKESDKKTINQINSDFSVIRNNCYKYNFMINKILINLIILINKKNIKINYKNFKKLDTLLSEKIIKIIYNHIFIKKAFLRSEKVQKLLYNLKDENFKVFNLKGMLVKKTDNCLIFLKKTN